MIATASRAERGLLEAVMKELKAMAVTEWCHLYPDDHAGNIVRFRSLVEQFAPDIVLVPCDRAEMTHIAAWSFNHNYIVAHFHAGNIGSDHPDEMNRRVISCFSHILLCNTEQDRENLIKLGEEPWRCHVVGSTAFDNVRIDESLCPIKMDLESGEKIVDAYDLVLLHPDPTSREQTEDDLHATFDAITRSSLVYWCVPGRDRNYEVIQDCLDRTIHEDDPERWKLYKPYVHVLGDIPREMFLGLLKNCQRFIGNSSALFYEAPFFDVKTVNIGRRNANRPTIKPVKGGSKKIAELLISIPIDDKLRRKKLIV